MIKELLIVLIIVLVVGGLVASKSIGKIQVCKNYFPEMNGIACFFTDLAPQHRR